MIPFIIVDDEHLERILIAKSYPWEAEGFALAGEAGDGEEGLALYQRTRPELVITDINMPFMDGLEFARQVKALDHQTEVIILTGFDEFDYAQLAGNTGVDAFLLKPVEQDDLRRTADKARQRILARREMDAHIRESFLLRLAYGRVGEMELEERVQTRMLAGLKEAHHAVYCLPGAQAILDDAAAFRAIDLHGAALYWLAEKPDREALAEHAKANGLYIGVAGPCQSATETVEAFRGAMDVAEALREQKNPDCRPFDPKGKGPAALDEKRYSRVVRSAVSYIDEHYCDPELSLRIVARDLFINDSYLSRVFKSEMKATMSEYVLQKRIQKACELLQTTDLKAYQVGEAVGINDSHYFGQCFKKQMGITVQAYRQGGDKVAPLR